MDAWRLVGEHFEEMRNADLRELFSGDSGRADRFTLSVGDLTVDFSKNLITDKTVDLLVALARERGVEARRDAALSGQVINSTEGRSVLHTALRATEPVQVEGVDVTADVGAVLERMAGVANLIRSGDWLGATGLPIRNVVNVGIGGSDLGPLMATRALGHLAPPDLQVRFVSNVDPTHLDSTLADLDPARTLFVIASKTFTTIETMTNAKSARRWIRAGLGDGPDVIARHFVALSTNGMAVTEFGIDPANMFEFWDWVGGRYSVGSAIGFSLMCAIGSENFAEFLAGFSKLDEHWANAPIQTNVPALAGLIGIWYRNFWGWASHAVLPYCQALDRFPAYLQQLDMESNGKRIGLDGKPVTVDTAPIVWGEPGTNGQHAFYQLLHQGTTPVPCDFIAMLETEPLAALDDLAHDHHRLLFANMVAQSEALAFGKTADEVRADGTQGELVAHRTFPGNRPSTVITAPALTPSVLGQLIALYEHRVFTQGAVWGINSFDQWGVELGKVLATRIGAELSEGLDSGPAHDSSTNALINRFRNHHS